MTIALLILWFILCLVFGAVLSIGNISIKDWKYWVLITILGSGFLIGFYLGSH